MKDSLGQWLPTYTPGPYVLLEHSCPQLNKVGTLFFIFLFFSPFSGIASCVGTAGTVTWPIHLTWPCCVALGRVLIWDVTRRPGIWIATKYFYFWVINIHQIWFTFEDHNFDLAEAKPSELNDLTAKVKRKGFVLLLWKRNDSWQKDLTKKSGHCT